jgi:NADH-quinone oxidoreductase subunit J
MTADAILFYLFAAGTLGLSIGAVASRNPVQGALSLVSSFFFLAALYVLLGAHFLAMVQVLVYGGAIMVLFLFVLMLLNLHDEDLGAPRMSPLRLLGVAGALGLGALLVAAVRSWPGGSLSWTPMPEDSAFGTVGAIGEVLLTEWIVPFELVSILLLAGIVGAVVIAKRRM